jgi:hypothetical protein
VVPGDHEPMTSEPAQPQRSSIALQGCLYGAVGLFVILLIALLFLAYTRFREQVLSAAPPPGRAVSVEASGSGAGGDPMVEGMIAPLGAEPGGCPRWIYSGGVLLAPAPPDHSRLLDPPFAGAVTPNPSSLRGLS